MKKLFTKMRTSTRLLLLPLLALLLSTAVKSQAPTPFTCSNLVYQVIGTSVGSPSTLYSFNVVTGARTAIKTLNHCYNAIGYNAIDNFIYGWNYTTKQVAKIGSNGGTTFYSIPNLPIPARFGYFVGDVIQGGYLALSESATYFIDLNPSHTATFMKMVEPSNHNVVDAPPYGLAVSPVMNDWVYEPSTGKLLMVNGSTLQITRVDPATGARTTSGVAVTGGGFTSGTFGAIFQDADPNVFYVFDNAPGKYYRINKTTNTATLVSTPGEGAFNDGASCPNGFITCPTNTAGADQTGKCAGGTATLTATVTSGTWSAKAGNPAGASVGGTASGVATASFSAIASGLYRFIYTSGSCTDEMTVTVTGRPSFSGCPSNPGVCSSKTLALTCSPAGGTYTVLGGPASVSGTTLTVNGAGAISMQYSLTVGGCTSTTTFSVTGLASPVISGCPSNPNICVGNNLALGCSPAGGTYSVSGGSASVSGNTLTVTGAGTITVQYSVTSGGCTTTSTFNVTGVALPNAGQAVTCFSTGSAALTAAGSGTWSAQAGNPGTATITAPSSASTNVTSFSVAGTYRFIWTVGACTDTANVVVGSTCCGITGNTTVAPVPATVCPPFAGTTITGSAPLPTGGTYLWETNTGAGFAAASGTNTGQNYATGALAPGTYAFRRTYTTPNPGSCSDFSNTVSLTVQAQPNAGVDQTGVCAGSATTLTGTVSNAGTWSAQGGNPTGATLGSTVNGLATVNFAVASVGTYTFIYTVNTCTDNMTVTITPKPDAGADQAACQFGAVVMAATGTGTWTAAAGNPGTATIVAPASAVTTIADFNVAGMYQFIWSSNGCSDTASVTITAKPNAGIDQVVCLFGTAIMSATGTGTWAALLTNPALTTITSSTDPNTTISGFSIAGTYSFTWTSAGCTDTAIVTVTPKPDAGLDQTICFMQTATLTGSGAGSWTEDAYNLGSATIASPSTPSTMVFNFSDSGTYRFIYATGISCSDTAAIIVIAKPDAGPDQAVCQFVNASLAASGTGTWVAQAGNPGSAIITNAADPFTTITGLTVAGTYNYIWSAGGCADTASVVVTPQPALVISAAPSLTVCSGVPTTLTITGNAGGTVTWVNSLGESGTGTTVNFAGIVNTSGVPQTVTYSFYTNVGLCISRVNTSITINPSPTIQVTPAIATICAGQVFDLKAISNPSTATIGWSRTISNPTPAGGAGVGVVQLNQLLPAGTYTYTFIATDKGCTSATATSTVTVN